MKGASVKFKNILFLFVLFLLFVPMIQSNFKLFKINPLKGAIIPALDTSFSWSAWTSGIYQKKEEKYLNETFGFRNIFIRLNNQIDFSFFNKANAEGALVGKENTLYHERYIDAYYGKDFIGEDFISEKIRKTKAIQDSLKRRGIDFIVVFEPSKARYLPEYFPTSYSGEKSVSNYERYVNKAKEAGIKFVDINSFFLSRKDSTRFPLYTKPGIHWSQYGATLASDTILKYIEKARPCSLNEIKWSSINLTDSISEIDYDMANTMNLLWQITDVKLAYPKLIFNTDPSSKKLNLLAISDSYYWNIQNYGMFSNSFKNETFWYYNKTPYENGKKKDYIINASNMVKEIKKYDIILLMQTEITLYDFGWGFIETLYNNFSPNDKESRIAYYIRAILSDRDWYAKIVAGSKENHISIRKSLENNAQYMVDLENNK